MVSRRLVNDLQQPYFFQFSSDELHLLLQRQLRSGVNGPIVWVDGDSEVILHPGQTRLALRPGLILIELTMQSDQSGAALLVIPLAVGREAKDANLVALTEAAPRGDDVLVARWGEIAGEVVWNALLQIGMDRLNEADLEFPGELEISGIYTDGQTLTFLASPPINAEAIIEYYDRRAEVGDDEEFEFDPDPQEIPRKDTGPKVISLALIDAESGEPIPGFEDLVEGAVIDLEQLPTRQLSIQAFTRPLPTGSVVFSLNLDLQHTTDDQPPYTLRGSKGGQLIPWTPEPGFYRVIAQAFTGPDAEGDPGDPYEVNFQVLDAPRQSVEHFTLIDADSGAVIPAFDPLTDGAVINLNRLHTRRLSVTATTDPREVGSLRFALNGNPQPWSENNLPYTLLGDQQGIINPWTPEPNTYRISATPFTEKDADGTAGDTLTISIEIIDRAAISVVSFSLIDAEKDESLPAFDPIVNGATIHLSRLPTRSLSIRANTEPEQVGSVIFGLNQIPRRKTENMRPYALFGDEDGDFVGQALETDFYKITATPFTEQNGRGQAGEALTITFTVIE